ncbi:MAG: alpha/beta fold hydrolase [Actinobacteria bacterium]|nr:alpha/beta fold hydrolase [Actinomycetota bacterium]
MTSDADNARYNRRSDLQVTYQGLADSPIAFAKYSTQEKLADNRVILIHGFTQNNLHFQKIAEELVSAFECEVICIDLPGHGGSSDLTKNLTETGELLMSFDQRSIWVGYSLGARHLLTMCAAHPDRQWRAIFSGVNPGIIDPDQRLERYNSDLRLANKLSSLKDDKAGFKQFLIQWTSQSLFLPRNLTEDDLNARLQNQPVALASSLITSSIGKQPNLWPNLGELAGHFTFITGGEDKKYLQIAEQIKSVANNTFRFVEISGLGHAAIFDSSETVIREVGRLLAK